MAFLPVISFRLPVSLSSSQLYRRPRCVRLLAFAFTNLFAQLRKYSHDCDEHSRPISSSLCICCAPRACNGKFSFTNRAYRQSTRMRVARFIGENLYNPITRLGHLRIRHANPDPPPPPRSSEKRVLSRKRVRCDKCRNRMPSAP